MIFQGDREILITEAHDARCPEHESYRWHVDDLEALGRALVQSRNRFVSGGQNFVPVGADEFYALQKQFECRCEELAEEDRRVR